MEYIIYDTCMMSDKIQKSFNDIFHIIYFYDLFMRGQSGEDVIYVIHVPVFETGRSLFGNTPPPMDIYKDVDGTGQGLCSVDIKYSSLKTTYI